MFRNGACVYSQLYGHGQVIAAGDPPLVRLLDGYELHLPADSLRPVPPDEFEAIIARHTQLEHALAAQVWGRLAELGPLWVRDGDNLWITPEALARRAAQRPGPIRYFLPDDLGDAVRVLAPSEFRADAVTCDINRCE